jgi:uncharacterized protein YchJ
MNGRLRNKLCECGSGLKQKNCCLPSYTERQKGTTTELQLRLIKKQAKYFEKKYKRITNGTSVEQNSGNPE